MMSVPEKVCPSREVWPVLERNCAPVAYPRPLTLEEVVEAAAEEEVMPPVPFQAPLLAACLIWLTMVVVSPVRERTMSLLLLMSSLPVQASGTPAMVREPRTLVPEGLPLGRMVWEPLTTRLAMLTASEVREA